MSERTREIPDNAIRVRVVAHQVAISLLRGSNEALAHAERDVARLTAGHDPDTIDRSSPEYIFGASDALSAAVSAVGEATPDQTTVELLAQRSNARLLAKIASQPSITIEEITEGMDQIDAEMTAEERLEMLRALVLIEPAHPPEGSSDSAWQLSPWGKQTYMRLLPEIAQSAGVEPTIHGIRGILAKEE